MHVQLGRKGDYAVRAVIDLARHYGQGRRKTREIAAEMDIPRSFLPQILADLVRAEILEALAGPEGGYALRRSPDELSLLDVVVAAEGPVEATRCVFRGGDCDWENVCPIHDPWGRAQQALTDELGRTTLADLTAIDAEIRAGTYRPVSPPHGGGGRRRGARPAARPPS